MFQPSQRIACLGGATLDHRIEPLGQLRTGTSNPVRSESSAGGTARNIAEALARLGLEVDLFSRVGRDPAGDRLLADLERLGADVAGVDRDPRLATASYTAVHDEHGELVMGLADMEILDRLDLAWLEDRLEGLREHDLWIVDANLPRPVLERLAEALPEGGRIYADPVSVEKSARLAPVLARIDTIFPDRAEAAALANSEEDEPPELLAGRLLERGPRRVVTTLGSEGVRIDTPARHDKLPAVEIEKLVSVNGAGDCLVAGFVFAERAANADLGPGLDIDPLSYGLAAASLAVESPTAVPDSLTAEALRARHRAAS